MLEFILDLCPRPWLGGRVDLAITYCLLIPIAFAPARQRTDPLSDPRFFETTVSPIWLGLGFGFALAAIRFADRILLLLSIPVALLWVTGIGLVALRAWQTIRHFSNL